MAFTHTLITLEAVDRAKALARLIGGEDYLQASAKTISDDLLALNRLPGKIIRGGGRERTQHELRRVPVKPSVKRSLPKARREQMQRNFPGAYQAAVKVLPPEKPYHVRLDTINGRKSQEWTALKSEGRAEWITTLQERFGDRAWTPVSQAEILFELRELRRGIEHKIITGKAELMEFVLSHELPLTVPALSDGRIVLRENQPKIEVDYDLLEQRFPQAATLVNRTEIAGYERIDFVAWVPTPEDPDDSDDSAFGMDYRARMGWA